MSTSDNTNERINEPITNVDDLIISLNSEIQFYKNEQSILRTEMVKLIEENKQMGCKLQFLNTKCLNKANLEAEVEDRDSVITNLKQQIFLAVKEKESLNEMWIHANKTVAAMEYDLKNMQEQGFSTTEYDNIKREYATVINVLEMKIVECKEQFLLQQKNTVDAEAKVKHLTLRIEEQEEQFRRTQKQMSRDLEQSVERSESLEEEVNVLRECRKDLEEALDQCQITMRKVEAREEEAQLASLNAIQLAETSRAQVEQILKREKLAIDEQSTMRKSLTSLISDSEEKVKKKVSEIEQKYNEDYHKIYLDFKKLELELEEKDHALVKSLRMEGHLREELKETKDLTEHDFSNKILELEKKFEDTFQKLILSERLCSQLSYDKEAMRQDVKRMMEGFEIDVVSRDKKTQLLMADLQTLRAHLTAVEESEKHLKFVISKLEEHNRETEESNYRTNCELQTQLKNQQILSNKWKTSIREIIEKLQSRITVHKTDNHALKKVNKQLLKQMERYKDYELEKANKL